MKWFLFGVAFILATSIHSQTKPTFFPEDILIEDFEAKCYCKPGVENKSRSRGLSLTYGWNNSGVYEAEGNTPEFTSPLSQLGNLDFLELKLKIPLLLKERTKILLGYKYYRESYQFDAIGNDFSTVFQTIDNQFLKTNDYSLVFSHSINEKNYLILRYKYATNGNYSGWTNFDNRFAIHSFLGMYGIKKTDDFEWGIGAFFTKSFRQTSGLPFLLYNRNFNDKWGIESMFPANFFVRHNISDQTLATCGIEYNSKSFRLNVPDSNRSLDYAFNHAEVLWSINVERHLASWLWANVKAGYQFNFSSEFMAKTDFTTEFEADPSSGLFFNIGIFISPDLEK